MTAPIAVICGIGEGLGVALAEVFAAAGHDIAGIARTPRLARQVSDIATAHGCRYHPLVADVADDRAMAEALSPFLPRISVAIHNAARLVRAPFAETAAATFEQAWRVTTLGAFNLAAAVLPAMAVRREGTLILTGATASLRGGPGFSAFASAKFALRGLAQSLDREYGPLGVHIAHIVVDGLVDAPQTDQRFGPAAGPRLAPGDVARLYLDIARQTASLRTFELDLRPAAERT